MKYSIVSKLASLPALTCLSIFSSPLYATDADQIRASSKLGLPAVVHPSDNPFSSTKFELGQLLFRDKRFSATGEVSCATCHDLAKVGTDSPLLTSTGIDGLKGTRNAPTIINAAFFKSQFWDGRAATLEDQSQLPILNPVEMGLETFDPLLEIVRSDDQYRDLFAEAFGIDPNDVTINEVSKAIGAFERAMISGNSRFDRWYFRSEPVLTPQELAGFDIFLNKGRCVSCHVIEQTQALFTDNLFHNIGVGINDLTPEEVTQLAQEFLAADLSDRQVDDLVLKDPLTSHLGRFAISRELTNIGAFKTSTLRNIDLTAPYMHDGSLKTLEEVVKHYNLGGRISEDVVVNPYLSGGIRPLDLTDQESADLVAFMKALTSEVFETPSPELVQGGVP